MRLTTEAVYPGIVVFGLLLMMAAGGSADCYIDSTAGYVGFWRVWESSWCGEGVENTVVGAFNYWDIGDAPGELPVFKETVLDDDPEIRLSDLEGELTGKRVALLSTHGGDPLWGSPGMAVEYYATQDSAEAARDRYFGSGYACNELAVGQINGLSGD